MAFWRIFSTPLATGPLADDTIAATSAGLAGSSKPASSQLTVPDPPTLVTWVCVDGPQAPLTGLTSLPSGIVKPGAPRVVEATMVG